MNSLDIAFLVILAVSVFFSAWKGFLRIAASLVGIVVGTALAGRVYPSLQPLTRHVASPPWDAVVAFLTVFFGVLLLCMLAAMVVARFMEKAHLRLLDRVMGALLGFARGWLVCVVVILALTVFPIQSYSVVESKLAPYLMVMGRYVAYVLPRDLRLNYEKRYAEIYDFWIRSMPSKRETGSGPAPDQAR